MGEDLGQILVNLTADVRTAFRRQWRRGVLAGLGLAVLLFVLAYFLMDFPS